VRREAATPTHRRHGSRRLRASRGPRSGVALATVAAPLPAAVAAPALAALAAPCAIAIPAPALRAAGPVAVALPRTVGALAVATTLSAAGTLSATAPAALSVGPTATATSLAVGSAAATAPAGVVVTTLRTTRIAGALLLGVVQLSVAVGVELLHDTLLLLGAPGRTVPVLGEGGCGAERQDGGCGQDQLLDRHLGSPQGSRAGSSGLARPLNTPVPTGFRETGRETPESRNAADGRQRNSPSLASRRSRRSG
jgi:hypothetical protein